MDITWYGGSCFRLQSSGVTILTDPFDLPPSTALPAPHVVTLSQRSMGDRLQAPGAYRLVDGPGEYEIKSIAITGVALRQTRDTPSAGGADTGGEQGADNPPPNAGGARTCVYGLTLDGVVVVHLGRLRRVPTTQEMQQFGTPDVLLFPVGEPDGLAAPQVVALVALATQLEAKLLVPARLGGPNDRAAVERLCKELGADPSNFERRLTVTSSGLPAQTKVGLLAPAAGAETGEQA
jgi:L-ascorbate metabolism protein UlaG (beta-lactamase superfamily)